MKFGSYLAQMFRIALCSSLALGLVLGVLVLITGGAKGSISLDIDVDMVDSVWFLIGSPVLVTLLFLLVSPLSFFIHRAISRLGH